MNNKLLPFPLTYAGFLELLRIRIREAIEEAIEEGEEEKIIDTYIVE